MNKNQPPSILRSLGIGLAIMVAFLTFAYAFEATEMSLEETREPQRQQSLQRVLRAIARPDVFTYEREEFVVSHPIWVDCPDTLPEIPEPDRTGPYLVLSPPCANPEEEITIEGFNFERNTQGPINFIPPSGVSIQLGTATADAQGHFQAVVELPRRSPIPEAQEIRVITRRNVGPPMFSQTAIDTWDKIVETVFMALLATTFGTILAVPISFFAARNLMKDVTSPLSSAALSVIFWPVGIFLGLEISGRLSDFSSLLTGSVLMNLGGVVVAPFIAWGAFRWAVPEEDTRTTWTQRIVRGLVMVLGLLFATLTVILLANLAFTLGDDWEDAFGSFGFIATFFSNLGEITTLIITAAIVLSMGAFFGSLGSRLGQFLYEKLPTATVKLLNFGLGAIAGAVVFAILGAMADWFYQYNNPAISLYWPAGVGAALGLFVAARAWKEDIVTTGLAIYSVTRTLLNALRSIEALIMVIVFAVWVSIGPFAGVLALSLHTVASLAKLYSEQVESISSGPLEAVKATGATRLQMIIYSVIPQIVPPYIAFTIYRWDINVRMSTIIGFAGGGGIGFLLQQNINLLNYRAASAQMLAIAIVVATMDYVSSWLRERII